MNPQGDIDGLGILVVGGSSGELGKAIASGLLVGGARVIGSSRKPSSDIDWPSVSIDVTDPGSVAAGMAEAVGLLGRLDAVINASGITSQTPFLETPLDQWNRILQTNLTGAFLISQEATRAMLQNTLVNGTRGSIVTIASLCALAGCDGVAAYSASKAGVLGMTKTLASELAPVGIRVNALVPGVFLTALNSDRLNGTPRGITALARTPFGRFGSADELVGAAALLAGRGGSFITGTEIVVDGGYLTSGLTSRGAEGRP